MKVDKREGKRHYNIPQEVSASFSLKKFGACILPSEDSFYFVYSGETQNLKSRAREHVSGPGETACLALEQHRLLHKYTWKFHYSECPSTNDPNETKLVRIYGVQLWRSKYGWPIICGK